MARPSLIVYLEPLAVTPIEGLSECCWLPSLIKATFGMSHHPRGTPSRLITLIFCHDCGTQQTGDHHVAS